MCTAHVSRGGRAGVAGMASAVAAVLAYSSAALSPVVVTFVICSLAHRILQLSVHCLRGSWGRSRGARCVGSHSAAGTRNAMRACKNLCTPCHHSLLRDSDACIAAWLQQFSGNVTHPAPCQRFRSHSPIAPTSNPCNCVRHCRLKRLVHSSRMAVAAHNGAWQ